MNNENRHILKFQEMTSQFELVTITNEINTLKSKIQELEITKNKIELSLSNIEPDWFDTNKFTKYFIYENMAIDKITFKFNSEHCCIESYIKRYLKDYEHKPAVHKIFECKKDSTEESFYQWIDNEYHHRSYRKLVTPDRAVEFISNVRSNYIKLEFV